MGEILVWCFIFAGVAGGGVLVWSHSIREKYTATIGEHIADLAQARQRLTPQEQFGLVDYRKWNKIKRDFVLGHFRLTGRREYVSAQQSWMNKIDLLIDEYLAKDPVSPLPGVESNHPDAQLVPYGAGIVYLLTNASMPGLVKIGMTTRDMESRLRELNAATGVPQPFDVIYTVKVCDCAAAEKWVHQSLHSKRTNRGREFFKMGTAEGINALLIAGQRFPPAVETVPARLKTGHLAGSSLDDDFGY